MWVLRQEAFWIIAAVLGAVALVLDWKRTTGPFAPYEDDDDTNILMMEPGPRQFPNHVTESMQVLAKRFKVPFHMVQATWNSEGYWQVGFTDEGTRYMWERIGMDYAEWDEPNGVHAGRLWKQGDPVPSDVPPHARIVRTGRES